MPWADPTGGFNGCPMRGRPSRGDMTRLEPVTRGSNTPGRWGACAPSTTARPVTGQPGPTGLGAAFAVGAEQRGTKRSPVELPSAPRSDRRSPVALAREVLGASDTVGVVANIETAQSELAGAARRATGFARHRLAHAQSDTIEVPASCCVPSCAPTPSWPRTPSTATSPPWWPSGSTTSTGSPMGTKSLPGRRWRAELAGRSGRGRHVTYRIVVGRRSPRIGPTLWEPAPPARFERATVGLEVRCSVRLSYGGWASVSLRAGSDRRQRSSRSEPRPGRGGCGRARPTRPTNSGERRARRPEPTGHPCHARSVR